MKRRRATTLTELLVVMSVWSFIMVAVLSFYTYGTKVSRQQDKASQNLRSFQILADKINTYCRDAHILLISQFPAVLVIQRREPDPMAPGCMLPNLRSNYEYLAIVPDPHRAPSGIDPLLCAQNALVHGQFEHMERSLFPLPKGDILMPLPDGMRAEFRYDNTVLMLGCNNPWQAVPWAMIAFNGEEGNQVEARKNPEERATLHHYFQFRGLTPETAYLGN